MHTKLLSLLRSFSVNQLQAANRFLHSPYHNENENLVRLFEFIARYYPDFDSSRLSYEACHTSLFPKTTYKKPVIVKIASKLFKLLEDFIVLEQLKSDPLKKQLMLIDHYRQQQQQKNYESSLKTFHKQLNAYPFQNTNYYYNKLSIENIHAEYLSLYDQRIGDVNLQVVSNALDEYYLVSKLSHLCHMVNRSKIVQVAYDHTFMNALLIAIEDSPYLETPTVAVWYAALLLLNDPNKAHYIALKEQIQLHEAILYQKDTRNIYSYLLTSARQIFEGEAYYEELFALYGLQLNSGIIYQKNKLQAAHIKNMTTIALRLGKYDWILAFLEDHRERILPKVSQSEVYHFNKANVYLYQKKYQHVKDILTEVKFKDVFLQVNTRLMMAKCHFECKELDELEDLLNALSVSLFRAQKKIATSKVDSFRTFTNALAQLVRIVYEDPITFNQYEAGKPLTSSQAKAKLKRLDRKMSSSLNFYEKVWLLEKVDFLLNG